MKKLLFYSWIPLVFIVVPFIYGLITAPSPVISEAEKGNVVLRFAEDKCIEQAKNYAQSKLNEFKSSLSKNNDQFSFSVKSSFSEGIDTEHMWMWVDSYESNFFKGKLANDPVYVKKLKLGDGLSIESDKVEDWIIRDKQTNEYTGGFSIECLNKLSN